MLNEKDNQNRSKTPRFNHKIMKMFAKRFTSPPSPTETPSYGPAPLVNFLFLKYNLIDCLNIIIFCWFSQKACNI